MDIQLTAAELANLTNSALDFYFKGPALAQSIQSRPTLKAFRANEEEFPGGKQLIRGNVVGDYTTAFMGYSYDDVVAYTNPANTKQFSWEYFELHGGIGLTMTELKQAGITVVDSMTGEQTRQLSGSEQFVISNLLEGKLAEMAEGLERSFNEMLWRDGLQSSKVFPGITALIRQTPTSGIIGGIDAGANTWWRNRSLCGASRITPSTTASTLIKAIEGELRQLMRYGGKPTVFSCGDGFIKALKAEAFAKGYLSQTGFGKDIDISIGDIVIPGVGKFQYEPTLDDLGYTNFCFAFDMRHIKLMPMKGENMKTHAPARPENRYVLYRAKTWTGALIAKKLNGCAIWEINPSYS